MRKYLLILLIILVILTGCGERLDKKIVEQQEQVIKSIGSTKDGYYVFNKDNKYYIYYVSDTKYTSYYYVLHKSEKEYKEYKDKYRGNVSANISYNDDAYLTIISASSGNVDDNFLSSIESRHKGYKLVK